MSSSSCRQGVPEDTPMTREGSWEPAASRDTTPPSHGRTFPTNLPTRHYVWRGRCARASRTSHRIARWWPVHPPCAPAETSPRLLSPLRLRAAATLSPGRSFCRGHSSGGHMPRGASPPCPLRHEAVPHGRHGVLSGRETRSLRLRLNEQITL